MCHENKEFHRHFHVLMIREVRVEGRDQIQRYYAVDSNETYPVKFLFMF